MKRELKTNGHILCVRPDSMGDILMTSPAFRALKETFHRTKITLLTSTSGGAIAQFIPEIDDILTINFPWEKTQMSSDSEKLLELIQLLQQKHFDQAIIFTSFSQDPLLSALICYLANIPQRLAYSHTKPYALLTKWVPDREPQDGIRHEVERQLVLVKTIGATTVDTRLSLQVPVNAKKSIVHLLTTQGISLQKPLIIIHPGANSIKRQYAPSGFAEIALLLHQYGYQIVCTGNKEEKDLVQLVSEYTGNKVISLAGELSLAELIALISYSSLLISNNTGPVHIAAALETPVVDLYALTNPQHTPWKVLSKVLYFDVRKELQHEVINNEIPPNAVRLQSSQQVVMEAIKILEKKKSLHYPI